LFEKTLCFNIDFFNTDVTANQRLHDSYAARRAWWRVKILGQRVAYAFWLCYVLYVVYYRWHRLAEGGGGAVLLSFDASAMQDAFRDKMATQRTDVLLFFCALYIL
jgi:hypothetical protein